MKDIIILGATGSIGSQTLDVIRNNPAEYNVLALSLGHDLDSNRKIIDEFKPSFLCARTKEDMDILQKEYPNLSFTYGDYGLIETATYAETKKDVLLVVALVGSIGLKPTVEAIKIKRNIALANKETLVMAGEIVMQLAKENQVSIFPIDSEHSAIYQVLVGEDKENIKRLIITASGGSFRNLSREELKNVTVSDALKHPNWKMGAKITIDSSTMMNKGFEVIEAFHLFQIPYDKIDTVLHPESIVHSMVEFKDSSIKAQLGNSDMRIPILYALSYPKRIQYDNGLNLIGQSLHFSELSTKRYPCLQMAIDCLKKGNIFPTVLNASNEAAVKLFLDGKISYLQIEEIIAAAIEETDFVSELSLDVILETNEKVQEKIIKKYGGNSICS